ncbi:MAG: glutaredoxin 3 [Rhodospirillales bacterium]|nr:glutaredoxin 3 [Rhodospirillales bacterium]
MTAKVEIYASQFCGYCYRAKQLLAKKNIAFTEYDVDADSSLRDEMIKRTGGMRTVPQIFIGEAHVGGSDELHALDQGGALDRMLAGAA